MWSVVFIWGGVAAAQDLVFSERTDDYDFAVALGAQIGDQTFSACTGSLLTPEIVLTAAHCGSDIPMEVVIAAGRAFFGSSVADATTVGFSDGWFHPDYEPLRNGWDGTLGKNDIGILVLAEPVDFVEPVWIATDPIDDVAPGETVTSVGFGIDESGAGSGVKRASELTVDRVDSVFLYSDSSTNEDGANVCSGDSGGPQVYWDGEKYVQWAVHSWADQDCRVSSGSTRVDTVSEWILDQVELVHGSRDRCEVWGIYGDGVCDEDCDEVDPDCQAEDGYRVPTSDAKEGGGGCSHVGTGKQSPLVLAIGMLWMGLLTRRRHQ